MANWTATRLNLRYHWKAVMIWGVSIGAALVFLTRSAGADLNRPTCADWNEEWFHHFAEAPLIGWCLSAGHADMNQTDHRGRTIFHRLALDMKKEREEFYSVRTGWYVEGRHRSERLALVKNMLSWSAYRPNLDMVDHDGKTAFQYAVRKGQGRPMAALLLNAGASLTLSPSTKQRAAEQTLPLLHAFGEHFNNPFEEEMDFERVFACQSFDCLLEETLKD